MEMFKLTENEVSKFSIINRGVDDCNHLDSSGDFYADINESSVCPICKKRATKPRKYTKVYYMEITNTQNENMMEFIPNIGEEYRAKRIQGQLIMHNMLVQNSRMSYVIDILKKGHGLNILGLNTTNGHKEFFIPRMSIHPILEDSGVQPTVKEVVMTQINAHNIISAMNNMGVDRMIVVDGNDASFRLKVTFNNNL